MLYPLQLLYLTMANLNVNINSIPIPLPEAAGKYFAGINARMPAAEKKVRIEAENRLPPDVQVSIKNYRDLIETNERTIQANLTKPKARALLNQQNTIAQKGIDTLLSKYSFIKHYADIQQEKRSARAEARKRQREPDSLQVPSDKDMMKASEEADVAIAAADEVLEEPENEVPTTELVTVPVTAQAQEIMPPSPPITTESVTAPATAPAQEIMPPPTTETDSANANKLAKALVDSLLFAAQAQSEPLTSAKDAEVDAPASFNVTSKPQTASVIEPTNVQNDAVAETIINAPTITPNALANVIVNALKLASTAQVLAPEPEQLQVSEPEQLQVSEPEQLQVKALEPEPAPSILPSALANVIVNALKLASTEQARSTAQARATTIEPAPTTSTAQARATTIEPAPTTSTAQAPTTTIEPAPTTSIEPTPATSIEPAPATSIEPAPAPTTSTEPSSNTGEKCNESPGFIALIQKYLEPIIGQFNPPTVNKPQKEFDKTLLPENMQNILDNTNIKYIGRYRAETKPDKNELTREALPQTTYLFWDTSTHDYISHTLTDVVINDIPVENPQAPSRSRLTTKELVENLPVPPRKMPITQSQEDPLDKKRRIGENNK
jgi:hypothetical protein